MMNIENPGIFIVILMAISMITLLVFDWMLDNKKNKSVQVQKIEAPATDNVRPLTPYGELINILDQSIDREIYFWINLNIKMADTKIIDFESTLTTISRSVNASITPELMKELTYYHPSLWVMTYIVRRIKIYINNYIRNNPI